MRGKKWQKMHQPLGRQNQILNEILRLPVSAIPALSTKKKTGFRPGIAVPMSAADVRLYGRTGQYGKNFKICASKIPFRAF